jgi:hypothetical protein
VYLINTSTDVLLIEKNLDGGGVRQSHEHTQLLMEAIDEKTLWDDHGVIADILVSHF